MSGSGQLKGCQVVGRLATLAILISQAQRLLEPLQRLAQKSARRPPGRAQDSLQASHQKRRLDTLPAYPALAVRTMLGQLALIHAVDRLKIARRLHEHALGVDRPQPVLLECNVSGEATSEPSAKSSCWMPSST